MKLMKYGKKLSLWLLPSILMSVLIVSWSFAADYTISVNSPSIDESAAPANLDFSIVVSPAVEAGDEVQVTVSSLNGTAVAGSDFTGLASQTLTFTPGMTTQTVSIQIQEDTAVEGNETFTLELSNGVLSATDHTSTISNPDPADATGTITNDDSATFNIEADVSQTENSGNAIFTVSTSDTIEASAEDITLNYTTATGTASATDFSGGGSVSFTDTDTSKPISIIIVDDTIVEGDEDYTVTLTGVASGPALLGADSTRTGTILNDHDKANLTLTAQASPDESTGVAIFTVTSDVDFESSANIEINIYTTDGTATDLDHDYEPISVTIPSATYSVGSPENLPITIYDDDTVERDESFTLTISSPHPDITINPSSVDATILNDDIPTLTVSNLNSNEGADGSTTDAIFTVTIDKAVSSDITVSYNYQIVNNTTSDSDFVNLTYSGIGFSGTAINATQNAIVQIQGDDIVERDESYQVALYNGIIPGTSDTPLYVEGNGTITNDDIPTINLPNLSVTNDEGNSGITNAEYLVTSDLVVADDAEITFDYTIADTSTDGDDITTGTFQSSISNGTQTFVHLDISGDQIVEGDETYTFTISNFAVTDSTVAVLSGDTAANGMIKNDDIPTLTVNDSSIFEEDGDPQFTVTTDLAVAADTRVHFDWWVGEITTSDDDFATAAPLTGPAFFNNAAAGETFSVPLLVAADNLKEPDETYLLYLTGGAITDTSDTPSDPDAFADLSDTGAGTIKNDDHEIILSTIPDAADTSNYKLSTADGTGATVPPNSTSTIVSRNSQPVFIAEPAGNCYRIDDILVNGSSIGVDFFGYDDNDPYSYTFDPVTTEDQSIEAQFSENYTIRTSIVDEAHGTITPTQTVTCTANDTTVEINAEESHTISWITVNGIDYPGVQGLKTYTLDSTNVPELNNVHNDVDIVVAFSQLIEVTEVSPFGTITPEGNGDPIAQEVHFGQDQDFTIEALTCQLSDPEYHETIHQHHISKIIVDGTELTGIEGASLTTYTHTFSNITSSDHNIEALFTSFVEVSIEAGAGTVKTNDDAFIHHYTDANPGFAELEAGSMRFDITPDPGYYISQLEIDGEVKGFGQQWTFDDIGNGDHTLKVWFSVDTYTLDPISNFRTIFSDSTLTTQATTVSVQYPDNYTFYIKLEEPNNWDYSIEVDGFIVDGNQYDIPGDTAEHDHGTFTMQRGTINAGTATETSYLRLTFTSVAANHRLEVLDFENTPIADVPLDTRIRPQPAVIMFVLDDSGSMDWEFMTEESSGVFDGNYYIFSASDNLYMDYGYIAGEERREWKSQWADYNKMYYNPDVTYNPWPTFFASNLEDADGDISDHIANADLETPRSHPYHSTPTVTMDAIWHSASNSSYTTVMNINKTVPQMANNNDHHLEPVTIASNNSRIRVWTEYTADNLDTMIRILDSSGNEYRWQEYNDLEVYAGGHYDDDTGNHWNGYIELEGVPDGNYTLDIVSYHGNSKGSFNLFYEVAEQDPNGKTILTAHYYAQDDNGQTYLVNIANPVEYYTVNVGASNTYRVQDSDLTRITDLTTIPEEVVYYDPSNFQISPSSADLTEVYERERQNFVNWFSYYRRRELSATAAIATFIQKVDNVKIGFKFINDRVPPLAPRPVEVVENMQVQNERAAILHELYSMVLARRGTPLRNGLDEVGEFFADDADHSNTIGTSPFADGEDGSDCKQVFSIVMTDGYWNGSNNTGIGDRDGDGFSTSLADVARYYYDHDLSGLDDNVPEFVVPGAASNPNQFQHMTTYTVGFGVEGNISATDGPYDYNSSSWGSNKIDDLWHAAVNGGGKYYNASRPDKLVESLLFIMEDIMGGRVGGGASVSINGDELYETIGDQIRIYQASYDTDYWSGDIRSFRFDVDGDGNLIQPLQRSQNWSAQEQLLGLDNSDARNIVTYNSVTNAGVELKYTNLTAEQQKYVFPYFTNIDSNIIISGSDQIVVNFLRGSRDVVGFFRERLKGHATWNDTTQTVETDFDNLEEAWLGDFVNSRPVFHDDVVYAGSNDGMLHGFDGDTGNEIFAYMPNLVFDHVRELADPSYTHKFYVDSTPVIATVDNGNTYLVGGLGKGGKGYYCLNITDAKNVTTAAEAAALVTSGWEYPPTVGSSDTVSGANRFLFTAGIGTDGADRIEDSSNGLGIFDTTAFISIIGASDYTREVTNDGTYEVVAVAGDGSWIDVKGGSLVSGAGNLDDVIIRKSIADTDMGYSFGKPVILETNDADLGYVVIVGNGYASESRTASLKIISLEGGGGFDKGELITTLQTGRVTLIKNNGLSAPKATDVNNDLLVDYVYAGDLAGNMWKFDLTDHDYNNWQIAYCDNGTNADHCLAATAVAQPLFTTAGQQPITAAPDVMFHQSYNGYMVIFGTGRYLVLSDLENTYKQSLYGIWDWAPDDIDTGYLGARIDNQSTTPNMVELTNWTSTDVGGARQYTLLRQDIWCEGTITAGSPAVTDYYRVASNYEGDWELVSGSDLDFSHHLYNINAMVPTSHLGWVFDLPGKITSSGGTEQTFTCDKATLATANRDLGERVTSDTIIRDGHSILLSYMKEGNRCTGGLYSFLNERNADTGGMPLSPIFDVDNDGEVQGNDSRDINYDIDEDGTVDVVSGNPSDRGGEGRFFNPVILRDEEDGNNPTKDPEETKFIATSTGEIIEVVEKAEKRGIYHWQQVE